MKSKILLLPLIAIAALFMASCDFHSDNVPDDGDFEGFWHLESIDTLAADSANAEVLVSHDYSNERIFWSFQKRLLHLYDYNNGGSYFCRFDIANGQITITKAYVRGTEEGETYPDDLPMTDGSKLNKFGIPDLNTTFDYHISGGKMTLSTDNIRLFLRRF